MKKIFRVKCPLTITLSLLRYQQHSLATMEAYDPRRNVWLKLTDMGTPCSGLGACALFGLFYTVSCTMLYHINSESNTYQYGTWETLSLVHIFGN